MTARRATVIAYHAVGDCSASDDRHNLFVGVDEFAAQMDYLARKREVVALDDVAALRIPRTKPAVAITFDDGYRNVLHTAGPILARHGFSATVFVPTQWIGRVNGWIEPTPCDVEIMDESELRAVESLGIRVESHGHAHIDYSVVSADEAQTDVDASAASIEAIVGRRPTFFAYPYGRESQAGRRAVANAGMRAAFTIDARHDGSFAWGRVQITPLDGPRLFAVKTSGRYLGLRTSRPVTAAYSTVRPLIRRLMGADDTGKA
jgi:peptidoglycan/xylan/chitin deacetylase (PgdA/CDA1 family)